MPAVNGPDVVTLVDGRTFVISDRGGDVRQGVHGFVHDDHRHLSLFILTVDGRPVSPIASAMSSPSEGMFVHRLRDARGQEVPALLTRRRTLAGSMCDDVELWSTGRAEVAARLTMTVGADFAHIFDIKAGLGRPAVPVRVLGEGLELSDPTRSAATRVRWDRAPSEIDASKGIVTWELRAGPQRRQVLTIVVEPVAVPTAPITPAEVPATVTVRVPAAHPQATPRVTSTDPRLVLAVDQALADLAALQINDRADPDLVLVAAGAPWYMTIFGRDSLLTAWMALPFDDRLARGVLLTLAELRGRRDDAMSEEEPGRIMHELRERGQSGPFAERSRYYGTVDATPLFLMLAAEAWRWGALDHDVLDRLQPAIEAAVGWVLRRLGADGFLAYTRRSEAGLSNQGWKDSWDGVTMLDGSLPEPPIALVEVQGYVYAALRAAAQLSDVMARTRLDPIELRHRAHALKDRFNAEFWDERGWFVLGRDGRGRPIDSLTTNPGHALWCGIAEPELADVYLDRLGEPALWSGWGLRTLATTMTAYDPLSYHNGSVWPHDTALCAAGAARYGRWDVVDRITHGALDAAAHHAGRPPELFAGIARDELPVPVSYPASCSPQAWSSASILLLARTMVGLDVTPRGPVLTRPRPGAIGPLILHHVRAHGELHDLTTSGADYLDP